MAVLTWDATGERFIENGIDHGVLYVQNANGSYATGVAWNGLTSFTESPEGAEPNELYADNIKYAVLRSAETYGCSIEAYTYPEEFAQCDGSVTIAPGVYLGQQARKPFGFVCRTRVANDTATEDDDGYKLHIIYNATASPSERSYETINDSPDAITFSWDIDTTPIPVKLTIDGVEKEFKPISTITIDSTKLDTAGKTRLAALEKILFGGTGTGEDPTLPDPATVYSTMKATV